MKARFELVCDRLNRFGFRLLDSDGEVLLMGLPCSGKIAAQNEVLHARRALRAGDRLIPKQSDKGEHFVVLKDEDGTTLGRSPGVDEARLQAMVARIHEVADGAVIVDHTQARRSAAG